MQKDLSVGDRETHENNVIIFKAKKKKIITVMSLRLYKLLDHDSIILRTTFAFGS